MKKYCEVQVSSCGASKAPKVPLSKSHKAIWHQSLWTSGFDRYDHLYILTEGRYFNAFNAMSETFFGFLRL